VKITDAELEELGNKMAAKIEEYRGSAIYIYIYIYTAYQGAGRAGARSVAGLAAAGA
jgi:hypothetical protein